MFLAFFPTVFIISGIETRYRRSLANRLYPQLKEDSKESQDFLVEIRLWRSWLGLGWRWLGADRGVLWVENQTIYFAGNASSFAIQGKDLKEWRELPGSFRFKNGNKKYALRVNFFELESKRTEDRSRVLALYKSFPSMKYALGDSTKVSQFPPMMSYREQLRFSRRPTEIAEPQKVNLVP